MRADASSLNAPKGRRASLDYLKTEHHRLYREYLRLKTEADDASGRRDRRTEAEYRARLRDLRYLLENHRLGLRIFIEGAFPQ